MPHTCAKSDTLSIRVIDAKEDTYTNEDDKSGDAATTWTRARIAHTLATRWCFWPYPPCTLRQLSSVHTYVIATTTPTPTPLRSEAATDSAKKSDDDTRTDADASLPVLVGVVGVVWVPLATATTSTSCTLVEGYVQVVLVSPAHRRCGVATRLLHATLSLPHADSADTSVQRVIVTRWRLHTMHTTPRTRQYVHDTHSVMSSSSGSNDDKDKNSSAVAAAARGVCSDDVLASIDALVRLYEQLGFVRRRALSRYYGGVADALELVKHVEGARKTPRRGTRGVCDAPTQPRHVDARTRWLGVFAELTAKVTHHHALIAMEGCELLRRLLRSHLSVAALLEEGDVLQALVDVLVGNAMRDTAAATTTNADDANMTTTTTTVTAQPAHGATLSPPPPRPVVAVLTLNDELTYAQLSTLQLCVDLLVALVSHNDDDAHGADAYVRLLARARALALLDALLPLLQRVSPLFHGMVMHLCATLLSFVLQQEEERRRRRRLRRTASTYTTDTHNNDNNDKDDADDDDDDEEDERALACVDATLQQRVWQLRASATHARCDAVLQHCADVCATLVATTRGPPRLAALRLLHDVLPRHTSPLSSSSSLRGRADEATAVIDGNDDNNNNKDTTGQAGSDGDDDGDDEGSAHANRDVTLHDGNAATQQHTHAQRDSDTDSTGVPRVVLDEALTALSCSRSHAQYLCALSDVWCLTTVCAERVAAAYAEGTRNSNNNNNNNSNNNNNNTADVRRFVCRPPATRHDGVVFAATLQWLTCALAHDTTSNGNNGSNSGNRHDDKQQATMCRVSSGGGVCASLLRDARVTASLTAMARSSSSSSSNSKSTISVVDADAMAMFTVTPGATIATMAWTLLLAMAEACTSRELTQWCLLHSKSNNNTRNDVVSSRHVAKKNKSNDDDDDDDKRGCRVACHDDGGGVLAAVMVALRGVRDVRTPHIDIPTPSNSNSSNKNAHVVALYDDVYLDCAMRLARSDAATCASLACRLLARVMYAHTPSHHAASRAHDEHDVGGSSSNTTDTTCDGCDAVAQACDALCTAVAQEAVPLLLHIALHNPTTTCGAAARHTRNNNSSSSEMDDESASFVCSTSALHVTPVDVRAARFASLGECALIALDACLWRLYNMTRQQRHGHAQTRSRVGAVGRVRRARSRSASSTAAAAAARNGNKDVTLTRSTDGDGGAATAAAAASRVTALLLSSLLSSQHDGVSVLTALWQCTRRSLHTPLRAVVYRALVSLSPARATPTSRVPSPSLQQLVHAAVARVRAYTDAAATTTAALTTSSPRHDIADAVGDGDGDALDHDTTTTATHTTSPHDVVAAAQWLCVLLQQEQAVQQRLHDDDDDDDSNTSQARTTAAAGTVTAPVLHEQLLQRAFASSLLTCVAMTANSSNSNSSSSSSNTHASTVNAASASLLRLLLSVAHAAAATTAASVTRSREAASTRPPSHHHHDNRASTTRHTAAAAAASAAAATLRMLVPRGAASLHAWRRAALTATQCNTLLAHASAATTTRRRVCGETAAVTVSSRVCTTLERVVTQYSYVACVACGLTRLCDAACVREAASRMREHGNNTRHASDDEDGDGDAVVIVALSSLLRSVTMSVVYGLFAAVIAAPTPHDVAALLLRRLGVDVHISSSSGRSDSNSLCAVYMSWLSRNYDAMVQWTCACVQAWLRAAACVQQQQQHYDDRMATTTTSSNDSAHAAASLRDDGAGDEGSGPTRAPTPFCMPWCVTLSHAARRLADVHVAPHTRAHVAAALAQWLTHTSHNTCCVDTNEGSPSMAHTRTWQRQAHEAVCGPAGDDLFVATLALSSCLSSSSATCAADATNTAAGATAAAAALRAVVQLQCHVLQHCRRARTRARATEWCVRRVGEVERAMRTLTTTTATATARDGAARASSERVIVVERRLRCALSLVCSIVSATNVDDGDDGDDGDDDGDGEAALPDEVVRVLCTSLCAGLRDVRTRALCMAALYSFVDSSEGRRCLLHECGVTGEPLMRSCYGRLLAITFDLPVAWGSGGGGGASSASSLSSLSPARRAALARVQALGYDVCTALCGRRGGAAAATFARALLRHRALERLVARIVHCDVAAPPQRRRATSAARTRTTATAAATTTRLSSDDVRHRRLRCTRGSSGNTESKASGGVPLPLLRLLAALSLHADVQRALLLSAPASSSSSLLLTSAGSLLQQQQQKAQYEQEQHMARQRPSSSSPSSSPPPSSQRDGACASALLYVVAHNTHPSPPSSSSSPTHDGAAVYNTTTTAMATATRTSGTPQPPQLLTILTDIACADATPRATLALLVVRNLCYHDSLKPLLCHDARVLATLQQALVADSGNDNEGGCSSSSSITGRSSGGSAGTATASAVATTMWARDDGAVRKAAATAASSLCSSSVLNDWLRVAAAYALQQHTLTCHACGTTHAPTHCLVPQRQQLAVSALQALMHDSTRSKAHVRALLQRVLPMDAIAELATAAAERRAVAHASATLPTTQQPPLST